MASIPSPLAPSTSHDRVADAPVAAQDVARGITRLFFRQDLFALCEVPLPNGRRADMMAICGKGLLTIVEIKVSKADLMGDHKWPDYLDYCDRFFWAVPSGFGLDPFEGESFRPDCCGLIVADRYDAAIIRDAPLRKMSGGRRKAETLRFARRAARRLTGEADSEILTFD
jgi:hypothetical protein